MTVLFILGLASLLLGVRRPTMIGGCGGTPRLLTVQDDTGASSRNLASADRSITHSELVLRSAGEPEPFETVNWRGDPNSFVDVFDVPILGVNDNVVVDGASFGSIVRIPYPSLASSSLVTSVRPGDVFEAAARTWTLGVPAWRGGKALRMVDRGECSASVSWRDIAQGFADGLDRELGNDPERQAEVAGNWVLTPTLRQGGFGAGDVDRFSFTRLYEVSESVSWASPRPGATDRVCSRRHLRDPSYQPDRCSDVRRCASLSLIERQRRARRWRRCC